ncbi:MAG: V-type ATP synthase subunit E, partial [Planctomycetes bacterium]|nr:V-type ATP synthase subunit E [Planctomycetota bacterium]
LDEAKARAEKRLDAAKVEIERLLAESRAADQRVGNEAVRDAKLRLERETARELERIQHENRLQILSAKNQAIDEVFKRVDAKIAQLDDAAYLDMVGRWLSALPPDIGGVLRVNPKDEAKFISGLGSLNQNRGGAGTFTKVETDPKVANGAIVDGPDYNVDCTIDRRLNELRESSAGDLARVLFGA